MQHEHCSSTNDSLQRIGVHIVARARHQATGRLSLRVTPNGFGTPEFGPDSRRVRVSGSTLIVESDRTGAAAARSCAIDRSTLAELAAFADVDLSAPLDVGHDTPDLGDVDRPISVDAGAAVELATTYATFAAALDIALRELPDRSTPTAVRLWPEHFDVAVDAAARPDLRVNLGGSPGDGFCAVPYVYLSPWTADRPDDSTFWNAPFGAFQTVLSLADHTGDDAIAERMAAFLLEGIRRLG